MRKLTERELSPEKTVSLTKKDKESIDDGATHIYISPSEITGTTQD